MKCKRIIFDEVVVGDYAKLDGEMFKVEYIKNPQTIGINGRDYSPWDMLNSLSFEGFYREIQDNLVVRWGRCRVKVGRDLVIHLSPFSNGGEAIQYTYVRNFLAEKDEAGIEIKLELKKDEI